MLWGRGLRARSRSRPAAQRALYEPLPALAPTLNFPISCWRGALAVPGREPGWERGLPRYFGVVLQERGHGEVSAGEDIPLCSDAAMSPRCPALVWPQAHQFAGRAHGRTGFSGMGSGDIVVPVSQVFLKVKPTLITDFISQTAAGLRPQSHSSTPTVGKEGKISALPSWWRQQGGRTGSSALSITPWALGGPWGA